MSQHRPTLDTELEIVGENTVSLSPAELASRPTVELVCTVTCASGDRTTATWRGIEITDLLSSARVPETTTHLRLTSDDGYCACVEVRHGLDGILATVRDRDPLGRTEPYETRFVAPGVDGERTVKGVIRLETLALDPGEKPADVESLSLDDPTYGRG